MISVQTYSEDSLHDGEPMRTSKNPVTPAKAGAHGRTGSRPSPGRRGGGMALTQRLRRLIEEGVV